MTRLLKWPGLGRISRLSDRNAGLIGQNLFDASGIFRQNKITPSKLGTWNLETEKLDYPLSLLRIFLLIENIESRRHIQDPEATCLDLP
jgi:hypothetical protein